MYKIHVYIHTVNLKYELKGILYFLTMEKFSRFYFLDSFCFFKKELITESFLITKKDIL